MHLLSDCRQNNNLTEGRGLCKAGWPVNKETRGRKVFGGGGGGKTQGGVEGGIGGVYSGSIEVGVRLREVCEARSHDS